MRSGVSRRVSWLAAALVLVPLTRAPALEAPEGARAPQSLDVFLERVAAVNVELQKTGRTLAERMEGEPMRDIALAIVESIPVERRGAAEYFALGNMFYTHHFDLSYELHKKAWELARGNPYVEFEWAMQQHRAGDCAGALESYRIALAHDLGEPPYSIYAGCLVDSGDLAGAIEAWNTANHPDNHTGIDFMIHAIAGEAHPAARRSDLLEAIRQGEVERLAELIMLDCNFNTDWWNGGLAEGHLEDDLALASELLGESSPALRDLLVYAEIQMLSDSTGEDGPFDEQAMEKRRAGVRAVLEREGIVLGERPRLPADSKLMHGLLLSAFRVGALTADELRQRAGPLLEARGADAEAMSILVFLNADADTERAEEINERGWRLTRDPRFGKTKLLREIVEGGLEPDDPFVRELLERYPHDGELANLLLSWAHEEEWPLEPWLVHAIRAEFHGLSTGLGMRDSYTLKGYFGLLAEVLAKTRTETPRAR